MAAKCLIGTIDRGETCWNVSSRWVVYGEDKGKPFGGRRMTNKTKNYKWETRNKTKKKKPVVNRNATGGPNALIDCDAYRVVRTWVISLYRTFPYRWLF